MVEGRIREVFIFFIFSFLLIWTAQAELDIRNTNYQDFKNIADPYVRDYLYSFNSIPLDTNEVVGLDSIHKELAEIVKSLSLPRDGSGKIELVITQGRGMGIDYLEGKAGERFLFIDWGVLQHVESDDELAYLLGQELEFGPKNLPEIYKKAKANGISSSEFITYYQDEVESDMKTLIGRIHKKGYNPNEAPSALRKLNNFTANSRSGHLEESITAYVRGLGKSITNSQRHSFHLEAKKIINGNEFNNWRKKKGLDWIKEKPYLSKLYFEYVRDPKGFNLDKHPLFKETLLSYGRATKYYSMDSSRNFQNFLQLTGDQFTDRQIFEYQIENYHNFAKNHNDLVLDYFGDPPKVRNLFELNLMLDFAEKYSGSPSLYESRSENYFFYKQTKILEEEDKLEEVNKRLSETRNESQRKSLSKDIDVIKNRLKAMKQQIKAAASYFGAYQSNLMEWSMVGAKLLRDSESRDYSKEYIRLDEEIRKIITYPFKEKDNLRKKWAIDLLENDLSEIKYDMSELDSLTPILNKIKEIKGEKRYFQELVVSFNKIEKEAATYFNLLNTDERKNNFYKSLLGFTQKHLEKVGELISKYPEFSEDINNFKKVNDRLMIEISPDLENLRSISNHRDKYSKTMLSKDRPEIIEAYLKRLNQLYNEMLNNSKPSVEKMRIMDRWVVELSRIDDLLIYGEGTPSPKSIEIYSHYAKEFIPKLLDEIKNHYFNNIPKTLQNRFVDSILILKYPYLVNASQDSYKKAFNDLEKMFKTSLKTRLEGVFSFDELVEVAQRGSLNPILLIRLIRKYEDLIGVGGPKRWYYDEPEIRKTVIEIYLNNMAKDDLGFFSKLFKDIPDCENCFDWRLLDEYKDKFFERLLIIHKDSPITDRYRLVWRDWIRTFPEEALSTNYITNNLGSRPKVSGIDPLNHSTQIYQAYLQEINRIKKGAYPELELDQKQIEKIEKNLVGYQQAVRGRLNNDLDQLVDDMDVFVSKQSSEKLAKFLVESAYFADVDKMRDDMFQKVWEDRDDPLVKKWLLKPELIRSLPVEGSRTELALWQLDQKFKINQYYDRHKSGKGSFNRPDRIRPTIKKIRKFVEQQFPKLDASRNLIFEKIENLMLTSSSENKYLNNYRISKKNWRQSDFSSNIKTPPMHQFYKVQSPIDHLEWLEYISGIRDSIPGVLEEKISGYHPTRQKPARDEMKIYRRQYQTLSVIERSFFIHDFTNRLEKFYDDPYTLDHLKELTLGSRKNDPIFSKLFSTYLDELPSAQRNTIMSYILATLKNDSSSNGVPLKVIFEAMGPFGIKAGQALRSSGLLTPELQKELDDFFNRSLPPLRSSIIDEIEDVFLNRPNVLKGVRELAGSGSINYTVLTNLEDPKTRKMIKALIRIQRQNAPGQINVENQHWINVLSKLENDSNESVRLFAQGVEDIRLEAIDTLGENGVELDQSYERNSYNMAEKSYSKNIDKKTGYRIDIAKVLDQFQSIVPEDKQKLVSIYEYVPHTDWKELDPNLRKKLAIQVLDTELDAIFNKGIFDPDGHTGNWLVDEKERRLVRIDYAQIREIPTQELNQVKKSLKNLFVPEYTNNSIQSFYKNISDLFDFLEPPKNLKEILGIVLKDPELGDWKDPVKRLAFIRSNLEKHLKENRQSGMRIRIKPQARGIISALGRLQMYREFMSESDYLLTMARYLPLPHSKIISYHLSSKNKVNIDPKLKRKYLETCLLKFLDEMTGFKLR